MTNMGERKMNAQIFNLNAQIGAAAGEHGGLPMNWENWQLGSPKHGYDAARQPELSAAITAATGHGDWRWPGRPVHFIADPHADAEAFEASLLATGEVRRKGKRGRKLVPTPAGRRSLFILGGDCLDKGPGNLELLRSIARFRRSGARFVLLAGNHDVRFLVGLRALGMKGDARSEHLFLRMGPKVIPLLQEVKAAYLKPRHLRRAPDEAECRALLFPSSAWFDAFPAAAADTLSPAAIDKELRGIRRKAEAFPQACAEAGLSLREVYTAARLCQRLFLEREGEFAWFGRGMKLMHREGSFLFLHAGVDDEVAELLAQAGLRKVNRRYRKQSRQDPFGFYFGPLVNVMRTKYRDTDLPLTSEGVARLYGEGIYAIVQGHRNRCNGQRIMLREGLVHIEADTTLDRNSRRKEGLRGVGVGVTTILPDGRVLGISNDYPCVKVFAPETWISRLQRRVHVAG